MNMNALAAMGALPGTGVPNPYPLALNSPLDRAFLRPLQEPLYDAELMDWTTPTTQIAWYQRSINNTTANLGIQKTAAETNINQSSMLDYPREFSILGMNIAVDPCIGLNGISNLYRRAYYQFIFSGTRQYLQCPFDRMPQGQGLEGTLSTTVGANSVNGGFMSEFKNGIGHVANYYRFNLGRSALKIKPGEAFNAKLTWPVAIPTAAGSGSTIEPYMTTFNSNIGATKTSSANVTAAGWWLRHYLVGLTWSPL